VDWANLIILPDVNDDGDATVAVDEDKIYEAMGFKQQMRGQKKQQGKQYLSLQ
jgi:hypothetical protein